METIVYAAVAVAWLAIATVALWGVVESTRKVLKNDGPVPFFALLEQRELTPGRVEEVVGITELVNAVRRCILCSSRSACGGHPGWCPNEPLLRRVKGAGTVS